MMIDKNTKNGIAINHIIRLLLNGKKAAAWNSCCTTL